MSKFDYIVATDFDRAWLNFELDLPLKPTQDGCHNPFYIDRPGNPISELIDALVAPFYRPPKFFFSGHRGCGKSTELLHLMSNTEIQKKYWLELKRLEKNWMKSTKNILIQPKTRRNGHY